LSSDAFAIITSEDAQRVAPRFRSMEKLWSWLKLRSWDIPTLGGVVVARWSDAAEAVVVGFGMVFSVDRLLLRSDIAGEKGARRRGGDVVPIRGLAERIRPYLNEGRTVYLLEPRSRFSNMASVSLGMYASGCTLEVVGPGFDVSDLKRGEIPHEWLSLSPDVKDFSAAIQARHSLMPGEFRESWKRRLSAVTSLLGVENAEEAQRHLRMTAETLLLDDADGYSAPPVTFLEEVWRVGRLLRDRLGSERHTPDGFAVVLSASLFPDGRSAYWDFVWARD
jgi:hypothetical protein